MDVTICFYCDACKDISREIVILKLSEITTFLTLPWRYHVKDT